MTTRTIGQRDVALNELPIRGICIEPTTGSGAVTVYPSDSGTIFINKYVTGDTTYTLPTAALSKGKWWWFFNAQTSYNITITGGTADVMFVDDDTAADSAYCADEIGECCMVVGDGTSFYVFAMHGTWTKSG